MNNNMRRSNHRYYKIHYGVLDVLKRAYLKVCSIVKVLCLVITFFLIPVSLGFIVYNAFVDFNPVKVVVFSVLMWVCVDSNSKL